MTKKRKNSLQEFRESAVKLITEQGYQATEAARNLGINSTVLGRWKREIENGDAGCSDIPAIKYAHIYCGAWPSTGPTRFGRWIQLISQWPKGLALLRR
ncbi:MAG: transposase [Deltaproteobacteria bacterium]|nr:transposase [Deltaproteobacteria bacterium]